MGRGHPAFVREPHRGFTRENTAGLTDAELVSLNKALRSLMTHGYPIRRAKRIVQEAVAEWLHPAEASLVTVERLLGHS